MGSFGVTPAAKGGALANGEHVAEAAGPLVTDSRRSEWVGAPDHSEEAATLAAAIEALAVLSHPPHSTVPLALRAPVPHAIAVGGMGSPSVDDLYRRFSSAWRASAAPRNGNLWLGGARPLADQPWVDRARALAQLCLEGGAYGDLEPKWAATPRVAPPDPDVCAVCYEDFDDVLPCPDAHARTVRGLFACSHAACRSCDAELQRRGMRCPECRAPRALLVTPPSPRP